MSRNRLFWGFTVVAVGMIGCAPEASSPRSTTGLPMLAVNQRNGDGEIRCFFSPKGGCTEAIVEEIDHAQKLVLVQAYSFTSAPIAKALELAHQRGVRVIVVLDKSQRTEKYSSADFVAHAGIETYIDAQHAIAHNKVMLIDGHTLITGSFNFTHNAENSNAENLLIIHDRPDLYAAYQQNFQHHLHHSEPYAGRGVVPESAGTNEPDAQPQPHPSHPRSRTRWPNETAPTNPRTTSRAFQEEDDDPQFDDPRQRAPVRVR